MHISLALLKELYTVRALYLGSNLALEFHYISILDIQKKLAKYPINTRLNNVGLGELFYFLFSGHKPKE
jgi:hypothetical protein